METEKSSTPVVDKAVTDTYTELIELEYTDPKSKERQLYLIKFLTDRAIAPQLKYKAIDKSDILPDSSKWKETRLGRAIIGEREYVTRDEVMRALVSSKVFRRTYYRKAYEGLKETYIGKQDKDYSDLLTEIYEDDPDLNEIYVRLVEEQEGVTITSAKQLQELTGIDRLKWDELSDKDARAEARRQIGDTFIKAMKYRYAKALEEMLDKGAKYSDLLKTDPAKYHLSDSDRADVIQEAIFNSFELGETEDMNKHLQDIVMTIEAPHEVVLLASKRHADEWNTQE
jgi:hypothetical protein